MIALMQRVSQARVRIDGREAASIGAGVLVLLCAQRGDGQREADSLLGRLLAFRLFPDAAGKMNLSLVDVGGELLLVPQFTLAADTASGTRPSFSPAAPPEQGERLFAYFVEQARRRFGRIASGVFGARMQVESTYDGPVTFWLQVKPKELGR